MKHIWNLSIQLIINIRKSPSFSNLIQLSIPRIYRLNPINVLIQPQTNQTNIIYAFPIKTNRQSSPISPSQLKHHPNFSWLMNSYPHTRRSPSPNIPYPDPAPPNEPDTHLQSSLLSLQIVIQTSQYITITSILKHRRTKQPFKIYNNSNQYTPLPQ